MLTKYIKEIRSWRNTMINETLNDLFLRNNLYIVGCFSNSLSKRFPKRIKSFIRELTTKASQTFSFELLEKALHHTVQSFSWWKYSISNLSSTVISEFTMFLIKPWCCTSLLRIYSASESYSCIVQLSD